VQAAMCYTTGDVYTIKYYTDYAKTLEEMGADSICIKDMAGLLKPYDAYDLVRR
jgi:oxaloacetate decarboxylase alpha subunit